MFVIVNAETKLFAAGRWDLLWTDDLNKALLFPTYEKAMQFCHPDEKNSSKHEYVVSLDEMFDHIN